MALPFKPESSESLRNRYPAAIRNVFNFSGGHVADPRPGELRLCVFDFESGIRLIISRDKEDDGTFLHISASVQVSGTLEHKLRSGEYHIGDFCLDALRLWQEISGDDVDTLEFYGLSRGKGVPHWRRKEA